MGLVTHIYERLFLKCPYVRAREYLREALHAAANTPQTAPVPGALHQNVLVRYQRAQDPMHFDEPWSVRWTPEGGGPYPDFAGQIMVRADESYRGAMLEMRGEYAPPFGALGRAFDMIAGAKIASATARALLRQFAEQMEERYACEEASKNQAAG